jgi:pimeloyl-ACP methyl ester carboxylesterase
MNVYLISGLATDARVFKYISVPDPFQLICLDLIDPINDESLPEYSIRLGKKIHHREPFILIGFSFGGIVAIEIAKRFKPAAIIIISSISAAEQLPKYYRVGGNLALHKLIPMSIVKTITKIKRRVVYRKSADKNILVRLADETDSGLLRWSFEAILKWQNKEIPWNTWHIHGSRDEILPIKFTRPTHVVHNAKHMVTMQKPQEINEILREILGKRNDFQICP